MMALMQNVITLCSSMILFQALLQPSICFQLAKKLTNLPLIPAHTRSTTERRIHHGKFLHNALGFESFEEKSSPSSKSSVVVRELQSQFEIEEADLVFRVAFGTFLNIDPPSTVFGNREFKRHGYTEWWAAFDDNNLLLGSVCASQWGSVGVIGPLTVRPDTWDQGVGKALLKKALEHFDESLDQLSIKKVVLSTFPGSPKHLALYWKHGFQPKNLLSFMQKNLTTTTNYSSNAALLEGYTVHSLNREDDISLLLQEAAEFSSQTVFQGMDLQPEIQRVKELSLGDTIILRKSDPSKPENLATHGNICGLAVCHWGPGSEADTGEMYIRFAAARDADAFAALLAAAEAGARGLGLHALCGGVNLGRVDAFKIMMNANFGIVSNHLSMERDAGTNVGSWDTPHHFVIDEWW